MADMSKEIWKEVAGFEGLYEVSNLGRVRGCTRTVTMKNGVPRPIKGKILKTVPYNGEGNYCGAVLSKNGVTKKK